MNIASQLRDEAVAICDARIVETLATAFSNAGRGLPSSLFEDIRHGRGRPSLAEWERARDYQRALQKYVSHKIKANRIAARTAGRIAQTTDLAFHERERDKWRTLMDLIEFGLEYKMP